MFSSRILFAIPLIAFAAYCGFGFLHSFEPGPDALAFKVGFAILGLTSLVGGGALLRPVARSTS